MKLNLELEKKLGRKKERKHNREILTDKTEQKSSEIYIFCGEKQFAIKNVYYLYTTPAHGINKYQGGSVLLDL